MTEKGMKLVIILILVEFLAFITTLPNYFLELFTWNQSLIDFMSITAEYIQLIHLIILPLILLLQFHHNRILKYLGVLLLFFGLLFKLMVYIVGFSADNWTIYVIICAIGMLGLFIYSFKEKDTVLIRIFMGLYILSYLSLILFRNYAFSNFIYEHLSTFSVMLTLGFFTMFIRLVIFIVSLVVVYSESKKNENNNKSMQSGCFRNWVSNI